MQKLPQSRKRYNSSLICREDLQFRLHMYGIENILLMSSMIVHQFVMMTILTKCVYVILLDRPIDIIERKKKILYSGEYETTEERKWTIDSLS